MANLPTDQSHLDELAEAFAERYRRGERPAISEYVRDNPDLAEQIEELFPALAMMEQVDHDLRHRVTPTEKRTAEEPSLTQLGDFRIIREVGRGGMGIVYEAKQVSLGRRVALKILPKQTLLDSKHQKRFLREARAAARLHHTNIVPVFGVGEQDGLHYYVMQFIHGLGLDEVLVELQRLREVSIAGRAANTRSRRTGAERDVSAVAVAQSLVSGRFERTLLVDADSDASNQPSATSSQPSTTPPPSRSTPRPSTPTLPDTAVGQLSDTLHGPGAFALPGQSEQTSKAHSRAVYWQSIAHIGLQSAQALQYAHDQGIIHRDVKPGNLLLDTAGSVWVADFGLAKAADQQDLTHTGDVLGTLRYMAPEQFDGKADARSDVFSLGLTLYELLALKPAFDERDRHKLIKQVTTSAPPRLRTIDPQIPRDLETIVHKAIDRDPSHRYQSAGELAADLQRYLGDEPVRARWISPVRRFTRWCKRNPAVAGLTSTLAVLLVTAALVSSFAAIKFEGLADDLQTAVDERDENLDLANQKAAEATANLALARQREQEARENLTLAESEQTRAEGNLDLALEALDAVYLDAIGEEKLLGEPVTPTESGNAETRVLPDLSELEKDLLRRGLTFYERFAEQNSGTPQAGIQTAQANYRVGLLYAGLGDDEEAEAAYRTAIERFETLAREQPEDMELWRQLAESYNGFASIATSWDQVQARVERLRDHLSSAITHLPQESELFLMRGDVRDRLNDATGANQDYERALELEPLNVDSLLRSFRQSYTESGARREIGLRIAQRAVELDEDNWRAHLALAEAYGTAVAKYLTGYEQPETFIMVDPDQAVRHFDRVMQLAPDRPEVLIAKAHFNRRRHHYEEALADLDRAVELGEDDRVLRSRILVYSDRHEEARGLLEQMLRDNADDPRNPEFFRAHEFLAKIAGKEGRHEDAVQHLLHALESSPEQLWLLYYRASHRARVNDFEGALADIEEHLEKSGAMLYWQVGAILGDAPGEIRARAFEIAEGSAQNAVDHADAYSGLAEMYRRLGEWERANRAMERAAAAGEESTDILHRWARLLAAQGELEQAHDKFQRLLALKPGEWLAMSELAAIEAGLERWSEARQRFRQVVELAEGNARVSDFYQQTLVSLPLDDTTSFRESYGVMEERFASTNDPTAANSTAWTCSLIPDAVDDYSTALNLATVATEAEPDNDQYLNTLGAVHYRAGRYDEALEQLNILADRLEQPDRTANISPAYAWYFLAMTHHALGQIDEAGTWLDKANEWTEPILTDEEAPPPWNRKLTLQLLRDEASSLINPDPTEDETDGDNETSEAPPSPPDRGASDPETEDM